jgi:CRP-like cAMP-binding protein
MIEGLDQLKRTVDAISVLPEEDWIAFSKQWKAVGEKRKQTITVAGSQENYLYFVLDGVQRVFYLDDEGREATVIFTYAPSFGGVVDSFLLQQPSKYYYETLTASRFLRAPLKEMHSLMMTRPAIEIFIRIALSITLSGLLERIVELQCYTSEEKYKRLLKRSPHILQLLPHKYLANYLGMDATNFSKLINSVRI